MRVQSFPLAQSGRNEKNGQSPQAEEILRTTLPGKPGLSAVNGPWSCRIRAHLAKRSPIGWEPAPMGSKRYFAMGGSMPPLIQTAADSMPREMLRMSEIEV